jgi:hypothetical protein
MGLILSEAINKVVEIPKILTKMSVEDAKTHLKLWTPFFTRRSWYMCPC